MPIHCNAKKQDIAKTVLMPGDPLRAKYIAETFLENARLVNTVRNMFAYTGTYKGKEITVFSHGMGMPSMGSYACELFKFYNVDTIIRIGTMGGYTDLKLKDIVLVDNSITNSNYGKYLCNYPNININGDMELNNIILNTSKELGLNIYNGNIYSSDVFYEQNNDFKDKVAKYNVLGVEMESFALFTNAKLLNKKAATLLMVSDSFIYPDKLSSLEREQGLDNLITLALETSLKL